MEDMDMKRTTMEMIKASVEAGYEFKAEGMGKYDDRYRRLEKQYRDEGYDIKSWYVKNDEGERMWVLYAKKRVRKSTTPKKVDTPIIDYSSMTVKELRKLCSEKKISGYSKMSKDAIVEALKSVC